MSDSLAPGDLVDHFRVLDELGAGAAAIVYRVEDVDGGPQRALKMLRYGALTDELMQRRFVREVTVMQRVHHPNLVEIVAGGLHEDTLYYVMELVDAGPLKDVLDQPHDWPVAVEVGIQLAEGLSALHDEQIVHRDLKPANVYLDSQGLVKIGDFGLAREVGGARITLEGMTVGTVLYMSPEQIRGESITPHADLYALGCVLFEMLTGRPPFMGAAATVVWDQHLSSPPPNPLEHGAQCPVAVAELVRQLLEKQVADRPADAHEVAARLRAALDPQDRGDTSDAPEAEGNVVDRLRPASLGEAEPASWGVWLAIALGVFICVMLGAALQGS